MRNKLALAGLGAVLLTTLAFSIIGAVKEESPRYSPVTAVSSWVCPPTTDDQAQAVNRLTEQVHLLVAQVVHERQAALDALQRAIARCAEDEVLIGVGDFTPDGGWSDGWRCAPLDDICAVRR
jgi:hypothetical protein